MAVVKNGGDSNTAPYYSNNICTPCWAGKLDVEFDSQMLASLTSFITFEARRQGHNDYINNRVGCNASFFHVDFLLGWPQILWLEYYSIGADSHNHQHDLSASEL